MHDGWTMNGKRLTSIIMLLATSAGVLAILNMPVKSGKPYVDVGDNSQPGVVSIGADSQVISLPFSERFGIGIHQTVVFQVKLTSGTRVTGQITVVGGECVAFFVMNEIAYLEFVRKGTQVISLDKTDLYVSLNAAHTTNIQFTADDTANYYVVIQNVQHACHDKLVTLDIYG